jgi:predicted Na+-dependent transporter
MVSGCENNMASVLERNVTSIAILVSIAMGFLLPSVGLLWRNYVGLLLVLLMFFSFLRIDAGNARQSFLNVKAIGFALLMVYVFMPLLAIPAKLLFSPVVFAGIVLGFAVPPAVATAFWTRVFRGDIAFALVITASASLIAIVTVPVTMLLATGTVAGADLYSLFSLIAELILIPVVAVFLLKRLIHIDWKRLTDHTHFIELLIVFMLVWGAMAPGTGSVEADLGQFATLNVFILVSLALGFAVAYLFGRRFGYGRAVTVGIATCVKNAGLGLVIGLTVFGSSILPPLIANLVAQNLLIVSLEVYFRK